MKPMISEISRPIATRPALTLNANTTCVKLCPSVDTDRLSNSAQARNAPITPPTKASTIASIITDTSTGNAPKPIARSVAISRVRVATAAYIVLSAAKIAPRPMMKVTTPASTLIMPRNCPVCAL